MYCLPNLVTGYATIGDLKKATKHFDNWQYVFNITMDTLWPTSL